MASSRTGTPMKKGAVCDPVEVLMDVTEESPWRVEVVAALPVSLQQQQPEQPSDPLNVVGNNQGVSGQALNHAVSAARSGRWMALVSSENDTYQVHIWYSLKAPSFQDQKFKSQVLRLWHSKWSDSPLPPLIALQGTASLTQASSEEAASSVFLYLVQPVDGSFYVWKFSTSDLHLPVAPSYKSFALLPLLMPENSTNYDFGAADSAWPSEVVTCLAARPRHVLVGTSAGRIFSIRQNQNVLNVETVPSLHHPNDGPNSSFSGFLSRLIFGGSSSCPGSHDGEDSDARQTPFLVQVLFLDTKHQPSRQNEFFFVALTRHGRANFYWALRSDSHAPTTTFTQIQSLSLNRSLRTKLLKNSGQQLSSLQVVQAGYGSTREKKQIHLLIRLSLLPADTSYAQEDQQLPQQQIEENRLYWLCLEEHSLPSEQQQQQTGSVRTEWTLTSATWLDRFLVPDCVRLVGLHVAENGIGYAALVRDLNETNKSTSTPILIAHDIARDQQFSSHLYELDLHVVVDTRILGIFPDDRTFGCNLLTMSGTLLRAECREATDSAAEYMEDNNEESAELTASVLKHPRKVASLLIHLRSTFWESYQFPDRTIILPPSIQRAEKLDLESAVLKLAIELQKDVRDVADISPLAPASSIMTHHLAYMEFLQHAGIYRSLMSLSKWHLMALGQEIAAYQAVTSSHIYDMQQDWVETALESVTPFNVAVWFKEVQTLVIEKAGGEYREKVFSAWLKRALVAAINFRKERCTLIYDISSTAKPPTVAAEPSVPLWTSKPALKAVLHRQIAHWNNCLEESSALGASAEEIEVVVLAALRSFCDSYLSTPSEMTKIEYSNMQSLAINLLRKVNGKARDALAWSLCKEHAYFWGLCQLAYDHRKSSRSDFSLTPLFKKFANVTDIATELTFGRYVIKWHIDRNLFGDALKYGNNCESDLLVMINAERSLRPYRWIVSIQRGDYEAATLNLKEAADRSDVSLAQAKFNLAMAKLANKIVMQKQVSRRQMTVERAIAIENKREIAHAQELLLGGEDARNSYPWTAKSLLKYAMEKVDLLNDREDKAYTCFIALNLCASLDSPEEVKCEAADVWYKVLMADWEFFSDVLLGKQNLTDEGLANAVLQKSVFGRLIEKCDAIKLQQVGIHDLRDRVLVDKFSRPDRASMQRLFKAVLAKS